MTSLPVRVLLALALTTAPAAAADATLLVGQTPGGLAAPGGMVVDTTGNIWVTDGTLGVCRVNPTGPLNLVPSDYCTPVGGGPDVRPGPVKPFGLAYDPANQTLFVGDGGSLTGSVWRMTISGGAITSAAQMLAVPGDRVFGVSFGTVGGPHLDYITKLTPAVIRVNNPATCPTAGPGSCGTAPGDRVVGSADAPESVTELDGSLYLTDEFAGAVWIPTPGSGNTVAQPLFPGEQDLPTFIASDPVNRRVYVALQGAAGGRVEVLDLASGIRDTYVSGPNVDGGFGFVTAMAVEANGDLLIADDPALGGGVEGLPGTASIYRAPFGPIAAPRVTFTGGPQPLTPSVTVGVSFRARAGAAFRCRVDLGVWTPCGTGPLGTFAAGPLADGPHTIDVDAADTFGMGPFSRRIFTVDTRPPVAKVDNASTDRTALDGFYTLRFSADEVATFQCAADGAAFRACEDGWRLAGLAAGVHTLAVRGVDPAGNVGPVASVQVTATAPGVLALNAANGPGVTATVSGAFQRAQRNLRIARAACARVGGRLVSKKVVVFRNGKRVRVSRLVCVKPKKKVVKKAQKSAATPVRRTP